MQVQNYDFKNMIIEIKVPSPGESVTEVTIDNWLVADGSMVTRDQDLAEIQSDKAMLTVTAEQTGVLKILVKAGETIAVGSVICTIDSEAKASTNSTPVANTETSSSKTESEHYAKNVPSVSAQKLMEESGVKNVEGTGKDGRITKADVVNTLNNATSTTQTSTPIAETKKSVVTTGERVVRREKMSQLRKRLAERLVSVKNETAMLTTFNEVDLTEVMEIRAKYKDKFKEKHGVGLGFMSFFTKACCEAMKFFPVINAQIDGDEIVYHDYVDVGIAVSTERGLVVPNVRSAEKLSLAGIELAIMEMANKEVRKFSVFF